MAIRSIGCSSPGHRARHDDSDAGPDRRALSGADAVVTTHPMTLIDQLARARVFDLEQPRFAGMPVHPAHKPGYFYGLHRRHRDSYRPDQHGPRSGASGVLTMMEHSGTHIDALCHQACDMTLLWRREGRRCGAAGRLPRARRGDDEAAARARRAARRRGAERRRAAAAELRDHGGRSRRRRARCGGHASSAGDVLLVRTGFATAWTDEATYLNAAGVSKSGNIWAAEQRVDRRRRRQHGVGLHDRARSGHEHGAVRPRASARDARHPHHREPESRGAGRRRGSTSSASSASR